LAARDANVMEPFAETIGLAIVLAFVLETIIVSEWAY